MSILTRISATFLASVDSTVAKIENHEAIINASLKESRQMMAEAKARLVTVIKDGNALREQLAKNQSSIEKWGERAIQCHETDRPKALVCIQRRQESEKQHITIKRALLEHEALEKNARETIAEAENKIQRISVQRNHMRTRQSAAEAQRIVNKLDLNKIDSLDETFERWDSSVRICEYTETTLSQSELMDPLDLEFQNQENAEQLEAELNKLVSMKKGDA